MIKLHFTELMKRKENKLKMPISQREMADATGMSLRTVWKLHRNLAGKFELIDGLCKYLECQPGDLLEYVEEKK